MSMYGAEFIKNMEALGNSLDYALFVIIYVLFGDISTIFRLRQFFTQTQR